MGSSGISRNGLVDVDVCSPMKKNNYSNRWCNAHFFDIKTLQKAKDIRQQLTEKTKKLKFNLMSCQFNWDIIKKCLCAAYCNNTAKTVGTGRYLNCRTGTPFHLHPLSVLYHLGYTPEYVVYHELVMTNKGYIQIVSAIEPEWLADFAPKFYNVRKNL